MSNQAPTSFHTGVPDLSFLRARWIALALGALIVAAQAQAQEDGKSAITPSHALQRVAVIRSELELIRLEMGKPKVRRSLLAVHDAAPSRSETFDSRRFRDQTGDEALMRLLIDIYDEDCGQMMAQIDRELQQHDCEALHRAPHALKGMIGNYCSSAALDQAAELDSPDRAGDIMQAREKLSGLRQATEELRQAREDFRAQIA